MDGLDEARIRELVFPMLQAIGANYIRGPHSRDRVYEALNALAICAAYIIEGTQDRVGRRAARAFFDAAVTQQVRDLVQHPPGDRD